ncbi:hypothetical protein F4805DRAFT_419114 [Annulohypoxylon moriforme]|nr:hypothetical protein F4805DRAFT_419114 [Annulohypoxylon moriforme]
MIYDYVFRGELSDIFSNVTQDTNGEGAGRFCAILPDNWTTPLQMLLVCKQVHNEIAAELYKKIKIEYDISSWVPLLNQIGPRYGALVQQVETVHECWDHHCHSNDDGAEWNCLMNSPNTLEAHASVFECLASNNVHPRRLKVITYSLIDKEDNGPVAEEDGDPDHDQHEHSNDQPYHDQTFINQLHSICKNVHYVEFDGVFNPLWALSLRKKLDFILKLENPFEKANTPEPSGIWTLINPKSADLSAELRNYAPSESNSQIYIKRPDHINYARKRRKLLGGKRCSGRGEDVADDDELRHEKYRDPALDPWFLPNRHGRTAYHWLII